MLYLLRDKVDLAVPNYRNGADSYKFCLSFGYELMQFPKANVSFLDGRGQVRKDWYPDHLSVVRALSLTTAITKTKSL
ncbi:MAG: hypothetical protein ACI35Z_06020 [Sphingobacterium hotanense]